jgi:imidazolonepropionase-like amidohydrolase
MDEATAKLMAEKGTWLSIQPFPDEFAHIFPPGTDQAKKMLEVMDGTNRAYELAKKYHIKTAWGSDILFSPDLAKRQGALLVGLTRWYTPAEALAMATGANGQLLALSGERSPYRGKLGVVEEGALADLLLVDGDPLKDIKLIADPGKNFLVIMKDGQIFKNTLPK